MQITESSAGQHSLETHSLARALFKHPLAKMVLILFVLLFIFWVWINAQGLQEGMINNLFGLVYPFVSFIAGLYGIRLSLSKWGGYKTVVGRGVLFLALGLLAEVFGQWAWSFYVIILGVEIPYPSIADIGYFLIVPFYSYAMYNFAIAAGAKFNLKNYVGKIQAIVIPILMIGVAYFLFLRNIDVDFSSALRTFLDFGYPTFEAIAISIGILTYSLSRGILGGVMRSRILYLIWALVAQYVTDYTFLYQVGIETYYNAGVVDLMYTISLTIMALGVISFSYTYDTAESMGTSPKIP